MKRRNSPLYEVKKVFKITFFIILILIVETVPFFGLGYTPHAHSDIICVELEENNDNELISQILPLIKSGYNIAKIDLNNNNNELVLQVNCIKLKLSNEEYYFKNQEDCDLFIAQLNTIKTIDTSTEAIVINYNLITSQEVLNEKLASVQKEKEDETIKLAKTRKNTQMTSRSGDVSTRYSAQAPLDSYVYISSYYGSRSRGWHTGVDFATSSGSAIYAWKGGTVIYAGWNGSYGNFIAIDHGDGTISRYAHCSSIGVTQGQSVSTHQFIGRVGSTGNSTGPHLHFEILVNGSFVNPLNYL